MYKALIILLVSFLLSSCQLLRISDEDLSGIDIEINKLRDTIISLEDDSSGVLEVDKKAYSAFLIEASSLLDDVDKLDTEVDVQEQWRLFISTHAKATALYARAKAYSTIRWDNFPSATQDKLLEIDNQAEELNQHIINIVKSKKELNQWDLAILILDFSDIILDILVTAELPVEVVPVSE